MKTLFSILFFTFSAMVFAQAQNTPQPKKSETIVNKPSEPVRASKGYLKIGDIKGESKRSAATRRRVEVLKSNKQGDPNKK